MNNTCKWYQAHLLCLFHKKIFWKRCKWSFICKKVFYHRWCNKKSFQHQEARYPSSGCFLYLFWPSVFDACFSNPIFATTTLSAHLFGYINNLNNPYSYPIVYIRPQKKIRVNFNNFWFDLSIASHWHWVLILFKIILYEIKLNQITIARFLMW